MKTVNVAVGVIYRNRHFFISRRNATQHQGNKWEFPGGKVDQGETPTNALIRELKEEIDIDVTASEPLMQIDFAYTDKKVCLHVFLVTDFNGKARGAEGQQSLWVDEEALATYTFPDANRQIIDTLRAQGLCK